ncbi:MAG: hypothetical protein ABIU05_26925 [Nitrospirales bacterium]
MTIDDLLARLDGVKQRGNRHSAICPGHDDRSPSLSISEGDRGLLLRCWAGCTINEICSSLGIKPKDLFHDAGLPRSQRPAPRPARINRRSLAFQFEIGALDLRLRAEKVLVVAKHLYGSALTDDELETALGHVGKAYSDIQRAESFEHVSDTLRTRDFTERTVHEHTRAA